MGHPCTPGLPSLEAVQESEEGKTDELYTQPLAGCGKVVRQPEPEEQPSPGLHKVCQAPLIKGTAGIVTGIPISVVRAGQPWGNEEERKKISLRKNKQNQGQRAEFQEEITVIFLPWERRNVRGKNPSSIQSPGVYRAGESSRKNQTTPCGGCHLRRRPQAPRAA